MVSCEQFKENYLKQVTALTNQWKENSVRLKEEGSNDEAILEAIKGNIGDIFYKMFIISYNNSCKKAEETEEEINKLYKAYLAFFDKIPAPWKEKMAKDKEHNMMEEYYKEQLKLETAEAIKNLFIESYKKIKE